MPGQIWRKASATIDAGNCVEISFTRDRALVRDSKDHAGPHIRLTVDGWRTLLDLAKERA